MMLAEEAPELERLNTGWILDWQVSPQRDDLGSTVGPR